MKPPTFLMAATVATLLQAGNASAQSPTQDQTQPPQQGSQPPTTFEALDADSDGRISKTEAAASPGVTAKFSVYDQNSNGFIEREEVTAPSTPSETPSQDQSQSPTQDQSSNPKQ